MPYREQIPIDRGIDNSLSLMLEGYQYISNRRRRFGRDIFETRLLGGKKAICIAGEEATKVFYDEGKIIRKGVAPKRIRQTLFGEKAIQTIDDNVHKYRKALFMSLMSPERLQDVTRITEEQWKNAIKVWEKKGEVVLFEEVKQLLTKVACKWAGIPLEESELRQRANELAALFDSAAAIGPRHWRGRLARNQTESWLQNIVEQVRNGNVNIDENTALHEMAWYREDDGNLLDLELVAVELLNILRPIVAIVVYVVFGALALHEYPEERNKLANKNDQYAEAFVQEIRRYYPFFPYAVAKVRDDFLWKGHDFKKGNLVLLDIYGTNHHPDHWENPDVFKPERFINRKENLYDFIPQGGGDYSIGHRCPGEWLTIEVMKVSMDMLVNHMDYEVPSQDLSFSMMRIPSLPKSRFVIKNVKKR